MLLALVEPFVGRQPRSVHLTGDDTPASSVFGYLWRMTGWQQVLVCVFAVAIAPLSLVPVELQRRIVDDIVVQQNIRALFILGGTYLLVVVLQQIAKFCLRLAQAWLAESTVIYTRRHLLGLFGAKRPQERKATSGRAVSIIGQEADKLGEFVGTGPSQASANITTLIVIVGYMIYMEPRIGAVCVAFLLPQAILIPIIQRRLNRLTRQRLDLLRRLGDTIVSNQLTFLGARRNVPLRIFRNKMRFSFVKYAMKSAQNGLTAIPIVVILVLGGYLAIRGEVTVGLVVAFLAGYERTTGPFRELIAFYRTAAQANVQHAKIAQWM